MHFLYLLARVYPYWALPLAIVLAQLYFFFKRRNSPSRHSAMIGIALLLIGIVVWFIYRGDLNSDKWMRAVLQD